MKLHQRIITRIQNLLSYFYTDDVCECKRLNIKGKILIGAIFILLALT